MENIILYANREAPLGWIHLTIYKDSTFEYKSLGIRTEKVWKGKALIKKDSIQFKYKDSVPIIGEKAYYTDKYVDYFEMEGNGKIKIDYSRLK